jgi:hypothetical protein
MAAAWPSAVFREVGPVRFEDSETGMVTESNGVLFAITVAL